MDKIKKTEKTDNDPIKKLEIFTFAVKEKILKKIKEEGRDIKETWSLINHIKVDNSLSEELRIVMAASFIIVSVIWIGNRNSIPAAHSEESFGITNALEKEKSTEQVLSGEKETKTDIKSLNDYKLESSEARCAKDKEEKKASDLCGKDDEDEVKKIKSAEESKRARAIQPARVRISAPGPHIFEKDNSGRKVCNKKNDHPGKSKKGKGKHMDMECCLDPDEYPNPNCYYNPSKYGKYL